MSETVKGLVSVVTPTYNRASYLAEAIESVLGQTYSHLEYHIVDDGSTDDTDAVIERYKADPRIRCYKQDKKGTGPARNVGLQHARGEFICFMDSDDLWVKDKLETQVAILQNNPEFDIVYGDFQDMDENGNDLPTPEAKRYSGYIVDKLVMDNFVTNITAMFRRKCYDELGGMDDALPRSDDYDLYLRYSTRYKFFYDARVYARVRQTAGQLSSNRIKRMEANKYIIKKFMENYGDLLPVETRKEALHHLYIRSARVLAINAAYLDSAREFLRGMSYQPKRATALKAWLKAAILKK